MSKQTFVFRDGQIVPKASAAPKGGVSILSDIEPYQNMKDFGWITSRSQQPSQQGRKQSPRQLPGLCKN